MMGPFRRQQEKYFSDECVHKQAKIKISIALHFVK